MSEETRDEERKWNQGCRNRVSLRSFAHAQDAFQPSQRALKTRVGGQSPNSQREDAQEKPRLGRRSLQKGHHAFVSEVFTTVIILIMKFTKYWNYTRHLYFFSKFLGVLPIFNSILIFFFSTFMGSGHGIAFCHVYCPSHFYARMHVCYVCCCGAWGLLHAR